MACSILLNEVRAVAARRLIVVPRLWVLATFMPQASTFSVPLLQRDDFIRLITNSVRNDLICRNEAFQCLALNFIGSGEPGRPAVVGA